MIYRIQLPDFWIRPPNVTNIYLYYDADTDRFIEHLTDKYGTTHEDIRDCSGFERAYQRSNAPPVVEYLLHQRAKYRKKFDSPNRSLKLLLL